MVAGDEANVELLIKVQSRMIANLQLRQRTIQYF